MSHYRHRKGLPSPRIAGDALASVIARYQAGETAPEIAASLGETRAYISLLLSRNSVRREASVLITPERKAELIQRYAAGENTTTLSATFAVPRQHISRWAREANVRRYYRTTEDQRIAAVISYAAGTRTGLIAPSIGITGGAVRFWAKKAGHAGRTSRRVPVDDTAFDDMSPAARYWIGFLMADGSVNARRRDTVSLTLSNIDRDHVVKFRGFCGSEHALITIPPLLPKRPNPTVGVRVQSSQIVSLLMQHGVTPRKTFTACASDLLSCDRDFWRGVIDGDGTMGLYSLGVNTRGERRPLMAKLSICGSETLLWQFSAFVRTVVPCNRTAPYPQGNIWIMAVNGRAAVTLIRYLYEDACEALERKSAKAKEILGLYAAR